MQVKVLLDLTSQNNSLIPLFRGEIDFKTYGQSFLPLLSPCINNENDEENMYPFGN